VPVSTPTDPSPSDFSVDEKRDAGHCVRLVVHGAIDVHTAPNLRRAVSAAARATGDVVVDLSQLEFIDSTGLHALVCAYHDAARDGWRLRIVAAPDGVQRVFRMTDLARVLPFVPPGDAAD
jgi:anti-sigma B factor antagonist